jgi:RNA polymerase-interacting CarD/CdnL/TRCF family regulator
LFVPVENRPVRIRPLLTAAEIMEIIQNLSSSEITPWIPDDSQRLSYFKSVLKNGNQQELLQMLQTIHEQQEKKRHAGKKLKSVDERMKDSAKKLVEQECAYVLQIPLEEVGEWLQQQILQK